MKNLLSRPLGEYISVAVAVMSVVSFCLIWFAR